MQRIFIVSVFKSIHLNRQTAILTPFREPLPATSHFNILGFKRENFENNLKVFISFLIDLDCFKNESSVYTVYK